MGKVINMHSALIPIREIPPGSGLKERAGGPLFTCIGTWKSAQYPELEKFYHYQLGAGYGRIEKRTSVNHLCRYIGHDCYQIVRPLPVT